MFQRLHYNAAASIVHNIRQGEFTNECPTWADRAHYFDATDDSTIEQSYTRAVQTAETFLLLFEQFPNPLFSRGRFLMACGLMAVSAKGKR